MMIFRKLSISPRALAFAVVPVYAALLAFIIPHHEPWRDETTPWVDLINLPLKDFFVSYLRAEAHPALWQLILMPFARAGLPFDTIYIIHALIAAAMVAVFVRFAPFSPLTKVLWTFSLPIAYEYAVVARDYSLASLLLFVVAVLYPKRLERPLPYAAVVFLLMQAHALVFMTGCALALCCFLELWRDRAALTAPRVAALGIMGLGALALLLQLFPPPAITYGAGNAALKHTGYFGMGWSGLLLLLQNAWLPGSVSSLVRAVHDNANLAVVFALSMALPIVLTALALLSIRRKPYPLIVLTLSLAYIGFVDATMYSLSPRHYFLIAQITLFALWIGKVSPDKAANTGADDTGQSAMTLINLCLFYACILTPFTYHFDYKEPFSASRDAGRFIRRNHLGDRVLVADLLLSLPPYLDKETCFWPAYLEDCRRAIAWDNPGYAKYYYHDIKTFGGEGAKQGKGTMGAVAVRQALKKFGTLSGKVFILGDPLSAGEMKEYKLVLAHYSDGRAEKAWIYIPARDFWSASGVPRIARDEAAF
jgi:hypothetical protein